MTPPDRVDALIALVQIPDVFDCWRSHKVTQEGKPDRFRRYQDLPIRYTNLMREAASTSTAGGSVR